MMRASINVILDSHVTCRRLLWPPVLSQCAVGASGLIFGLIVVDNAEGGHQHRNILGVVNLPARLYPWALLLLTQLLMPSVSFVGHLSGILVSMEPEVSTFYTT